MHNLNALKRLVKKVTGEDSNAKSIRGAIDEIASGYTGNPIASNQADSTAEDVAGLVTDFNALLTKLKTAGIMEEDS